MKTKHLLLTLLLALAVPLAALAQVERTVTVYNGTDKECHVPLYGNVTRMDDLSYSQFIMDKSVLQAAGLAGKEITKMTLHLANSVPASYEWTTKRRTVVTLAEVDASQMDGGFIQDMTNSTNVFADYLDAHGETMEISFGTPFTYSGEKNLLVQFREEYMYYFNYHPFASYRLPMYYGVYKTGASYWRQVRATNSYSTVSSLNCHFVPKTTFTYLTEANWANTKAPKNARITASNYSTGNNNSINYYIRMDWDASDNYTGSYQVLCVPRGTTPLDWSTAATTSDTFYLFEGLQKNTAYDLYVRAKSGIFYTSNVATASATTPFYPANLDEGPLTFDFNSQTMPNGLDFDCNIPRYLSAYGRLSYCNLGTNYVGATVYNTTPAITITLPELKFTNASNGLMLDFDLQGVGWEVHSFHTAELQVKIYDHGSDEEVFSETVSASYPSQHFTFRLPNLTTSNYHIYKLSFIYAGGPGFNLDNIVVRKAPNIIPAYNLAASNITHTSATISWTDDNTGTRSLELYYRPSGNSAWISPISVTGTSHTLTGLTPYTEYEVMVKTIVGTEFSNSEIYSFSTLCTPATVPFNESFTGLTTLPTDWRVNVPEYAEVVTEVGNGRLTLHNTATEVTQNIYGYISTYTSYSEFGAYIILPYFNNLGSLQLSFKAGRTQGTMGSLSVGVVADPNNYTDYTEIGTATLTDNANGEVYSYNLVNNAVQSGHIVIYFGKYESNLQSIWLDDFSVQQYAAPTNLEVSNVTNNSATLGWNAGAATEWEVQYKQTTASTWTTVTPNPTSNSCTLTGLTASTDYVAQVRAKYGESYSVWVDFEGFKTLMQEAYALGATTNQTYFEDFESSVGNWMFVDGGSSGNRWRRFSYGDYGKGLRVTNSTASGSIINFEWKYVTCLESTFGGMGVLNPATTYAVKTFSLSAGHYEFDYRYAVKGRANDDYMRVVLVPAETVLVNGTLPTGFDYANTPAGWFSLDGGGQLTGNSNNYYSWTDYSWTDNNNTSHSTIPLDVYPGGTYEPGNYMIVVLWNNEGTQRSDAAQNPPGAIDNVSVTWSPLVYPPAVAALHDQVTDTEAPLALYVPEQGITPTSYEVQYEPAAAVNTYEGAPIATFNVTETPQTVTLTGLTPLTLYSARVRSVYTANGHSVYSDWQDCPNLFTTLCTHPTNLVVVGQTTSWANVMWTPVEMTLPSSQSIHYEYQLTTDQNNWDVPIISTNFGNNSCSQNFAPGTYYIRVRTYVEEYTGSELLRMGESDWTEPITFTIAPWTDPVSIFPLAYGFDEGLNRFADGITLGGDITLLNIVGYDDHELPIHGGGASTYTLAFGSSSPCDSYFVFPPMSPSNGDLLVSFWWYHDNAETNSNAGVTIECSYDGTTWQSVGDKITRYAEQTDWVKYQQVVNADSSPTYVRLHFEGPDSSRPWAYCFLDDLTVNIFKSERPYISYVGCDGNSATITLYDYAVENGYHSSQFEVQYREWRDPSETQNEWVDYPIFENEAPYAFERTLTLNGLQPATCYEFRACACVSYGDIDYWSGYCEPYRQWTDCGTYTITPTYSYTEDFEELFNGTDCWTIEGNWTMQQSGGHDGDYCAYCPGSVNLQDNAFLTSPAISFSGCNNVILRFWSKGKGIVRVYYGEGFAEHGDIFTLSATEDWEKIELSLSYFMNKGPIKVCFYRKYNNTSAWYVDDVSIIANVYEKVFDCKWNEVGLLTSAGNWYPNGVPSASDEVMIMRGSQVYYSNSPFSCGTINFGTSGSVWVRENCMLTVTTFNATKRLTVDGTANVTTLNPGAANSVVVKSGGTLYAGSITGTSSTVNNTVVVEDGGQLKLDNLAYATIKKSIGSYTAIEQQYGVEKGGYYLISSPLYSDFYNLALANACTFVEEESGEIVNTYDLYEFNYEQDLEWRNYKEHAFLMERCKGALYANRDGVELSFAGPVGANNTTVYANSSYSQGGTYNFNGWKLLGNPFPCNAYITDVSAPDAMSFYRMNESGTGFIAATGAIAPMEGIFVHATMSAQGFGFTRNEPTQGGAKLGINLKKGNMLVDNAIIRFAEGGELPKFSFSDNTSKVYFPMKDKDYAVMHSQPVGELPLNFEAAEDGIFTLSFEDGTEDLVYCHLIDNLTGADVDLLSAGDCGAESAMTTEGVSYTFTAKKTDYASRFRVVFAAKGAGEDACEPSFAFENNGNWIILNEGRATLQVIDLNGRILSSEQIEGSVQTSIHQPAGLYLIRLLNGNDVKVQKVIVK